MRRDWRFRFGLITLLLLGGVAHVAAADLDGPPRRAPRIVRGPAVPPNCRIIPQPLLNLSKEDVVGARPQLVCFSRGLLADSMQPYRVLPPRPWWDFWP